MVTSLSASLFCHLYHMPTDIHHLSYLYFDLHLLSMIGYLRKFIQMLQPKIKRKSILRTYSLIYIIMRLHYGIIRRLDITNHSWVMCS